MAEVIQYPDQAVEKKPPENELEVRARLLRIAEQIYLGQYATRVQVEAALQELSPYVGPFGCSNSELQFALTHIEDQLASLDKINGRAINIRAYFELMSEWRDIQERSRNFNVQLAVRRFRKLTAHYELPDDLLPPVDEVELVLKKGFQAEATKMLTTLREKASGGRKVVTQARNLINYLTNKHVKSEAIGITDAELRELAEGPRK